jgi:solute carrier family 25 (peroxisomal adenine nucleotide transporter), member 17
MASQGDDPALVQALSGIGGQVFSSLLTYPLDVIKTRVQTSLAVKAAPGAAAADDSFSGVLGTILAESGWRGLYHGLGGEITKESLKTFVYFYMYTYIKGGMRAALLPPPGSSSDGAAALPPLSVGKNLVAGALAAACGQLANNPMNVAHTRMVAGTSSNGFLGTIRDMYAEGGVAELYAGILPSLLLTCNPAINYAVFDQAKAALLRYKARKAAGAAKAAGGAKAAAAEQPVALAPSSPSSSSSAPPSAPSSSGSESAAAAAAAPPAAAAELSAFEAFLIGVLAKLTSTVATYPLIRAKVVVQSGVSRYSSTLLVMLFLIKSEGVLGVYKGLKPQLLRAIFGGALLVMGKEKIQQAVRAAVLSKRGQ